MAADLALFASHQDSLFSNVRFVLNRFWPRCRWCGGDTPVQKVEIEARWLPDEIRVHFECHGDGWVSAFSAKRLRMLMGCGRHSEFVQLLSAPVFESSIGACEKCSSPITKPCNCRRACPWDGPDEDA